MPTTEELDAWSKLQTPPFVGTDFDDESERCSKPGCDRGHWDDGAPLMDFTVVCSPGEEGYSEVTQLLCMEHSADMVQHLAAIGFTSHNHHGTCTLENDTCGGYGKCSTPAEYGPELVRPELSTWK